MSLVELGPSLRITREVSCWFLRTLVVRCGVCMRRGCGPMAQSGEKAVVNGVRQRQLIPREDARRTVCNV